MPEVDQISRGIVRRVMEYGAIIRLDDGTVGLTHISELDNRYVKDVSRYCKEGFPVVVQVLRQREDGRWEFSMKAARNNPDARPLWDEVAAELAANPQPEVLDETGSDSGNFGGARPIYDDSAPHQPLPRAAVSPKKRAEFDEKMRDFLTDSSDHIEDVKRHHENRLGGRRR